MAFSTANRVIAAAIPGMCLAKNNWATAGETLARLAESVTAGALPVSTTDAQPDVEASLWFVRAVQIFAKEGCGDEQLIARLRETTKQIVQEFISEQGVGGMVMDHGGMLAGAPLRINALWYSALGTAAVDLKAVGDKSSDHFDRLAGRFRRAFVKTFWCEEHLCICSPEVRQGEEEKGGGGDSHGELPDPDQLILPILPTSPLPRTKQRQMILTLQERLLKGCEIGIWLQHPVLGRVESVVHRAWLAVSIVNIADNRAAAMPEAQAILAPLKPLLNSATGIAAFYRDGKPLGEPDRVTAAEVMGAMGAMGTVGGEGG
ncbi:MAG: hypothetical protein FWD53_05105 [Phycisphaerales bacterium]|nr:hypothetical protein [Phycisphaerales bacterium]